MEKQAQSALLDTLKVVLYWLLSIASVGLGLYYRKNRSKGWTLYKLILGTIICQTAYWSMWAIHNSAVRSVGLGQLTDNLYRVCIPLNQLATASFMGLLLVLAAGYCITRSDLGEYKLQVVGLPVLLFVTGVVTQYINFQLLEATTDQLDVLDMAGWEAGLFAVCTFANVAAFLFWVVYIFEIIQTEVDALRAQQELNLVRNAAPSATVAPFPAASSRTSAPANPHALPPSNIDPEWARAAAEEGVVAYKNLLGPNQNMSHIAGADVEAQEITTVADMLNFETKKQMYRRFSNGFAVFMVAQLCVILAPVFIIDVVQEVITLFQFLVVLGFLAALLWLFRPQQDSPYLLMGEDVEHLDTSLGVDDDATEFAGDGGAANGQHRDEQGRRQTRNGFGARDGSSSGVELAGMGAAAKRASEGGAGDGWNNVSFTLDGDGDGVSGGRDQSGAGAAPHLPEVRLPAIRTSIPAVAQQQQQQQRPLAAAPAAPAAAAAAGSNGVGPQWSLGDEDELHEITLHGSSPQKQVSG
ncbi:hypothetical protein COO60DRAFT_1704191 [Scenedesmus sp. NREL 46B-D3]|nr:hypothetical protein COO60DRAFT_1704191 [Scenedesmus sp. NREL 46B-D3]